MNNILNFQNSCFGDSGGPAIWEDTNDRNRAYLVGIIFMGSNTICGIIPTNKFLSSQAVTVPGRVYAWVYSKTQPEIIECLRPTPNK